MKHQARRAGFTLFEVLIVLSILSVVTTIGVTTFASITTSYRETERRMALDSKAQHIFDALREDCSMLTASSLCGATLHATRAMEEQRRYGRVPLENDHLVMPVSYYNPLQHSVERVTMMYHIDRDGSVPVLKRTIEGGYRHDEPNGASQVIAEGVLSIRFEFFDGADWQVGWSGKTHPLAVRCSVTVQDPDYPFEQVSRTAAFALQVR